MRSKSTIYSKFKQQVCDSPDTVAVFDEHRSLTYRDLDILVNAIASTFPVSAKHVGVVMDHGVEQVASILAVLKTGAAFVAVEPALPDKRIQFILKECDADFVISNHKYARKLPGFLLMLIERQIPLHPKSAMMGDFSMASDVAYVMYTSGATGTPKGVMVTNANLCSYIDAFAEEFKLRRGDVMLQHSDCSFDIFIEEVFGALLSGITLAIPNSDTRADMQRLMHFVEKNKVTIISGFPYLLLEMNKLHSIPSSLRLLISGGDVLRASYVDRLLHFAEVYNTYGPTETTVCATFFRCNDTAPLDDGTYPIGKAAKGVQIEIRDTLMRPLPPGNPGEICIFGNGVSLGYVVDKKKENRNFVTLKDGRRMYRSGDFGAMMPDGTVLFYRRFDSQVMIMGKRVETGEVESVLGECPEVEKCVVRAEIDAKGLSYLVAYIVPGRKVKFNIETIKERMRSFLPDYMLPEFFVTLNSLQLTPAGKVDRSQLPHVYK